MDKEYFLLKYGIDEQKFENSGIVWDELIRIYDDYTRRQAAYENTARQIVNRLNREKAIHSIKYRIKDSEHLIEKIIRKTIQKPDANINVKNYRQRIRDLIGLRAMHLFKEEWASIHDYLFANWEMLSAPRANYKKGDSEQLLESYMSRGLVLNEHIHGYRSIHYYIKLKQGRAEIAAEVQLRTLFEEAWSEIDHYLRYSANKDIDVAEPYLGVLGNITSNADKIASYMRWLYGAQQTEGQAVGANAGADANAAAAAAAAAGDGRIGGPADGMALPFESEQINIRDIYKSVIYDRL